MKKLLVFLTDPLKVLYAKGEIKPRYYNPDNIFSEVHFISPASDEITPEKVQSLVGDRAAIRIYPIGLPHYCAGILPFGRLAAQIRRIRPTIIRAYNPGVAGSLAILRSKRLSIPSVISLHSNPDDQRKYEKRVLYKIRRTLEY